MQITQTRDFSGLTESNHLSNAYLTEPEKIGSVLAYAFGKSDDNVISLLTGGIRQTRFVNNREYTWDLHAQSDKAYEISEVISQGATPGQFGAPVKLVFADKVFEATDVILADDGVSTLRISREPESYGTGWLYYGFMIKASASFIDPALLEAGARWSKEYSVVEELSSRGGGHTFSTPFKMRNQLTTLRKTYTVSRDAAKAVMVLELYHPDGTQSTKLWTKLEEWTALSKWYKELDNSYIYSEYNKNAVKEVTLKGESKRPVYIGAGFREQIDRSNKRGYTKLTYQILDEFLLDLSYAAKKWGGECNFVGLTGKMGMREFDRAITEYNNGAGFTITNSGTFITGSGSELVLGGHFRTVHFNNGVSLTMKEFSPYDDIVRNRQLHPITQKPLESYRITIMNFGTKDGKGNIQKVALQDSEDMMWHVSGSTDPYGLTAKSISTSKASGLDGYEVHFLSQCGIQVGDPTTCGELYMKLV